jgi:hypothetical protein
VVHGAIDMEVLAPQQPIVQSPLSIIDVAFDDARKPEGRDRGPRLGQGRALCLPSWWLAAPCARRLQETASLLSNKQSRGGEQYECNNPEVGNGYQAHR